MSDKIKAHWDSFGAAYATRHEPEMITATRFMLACLALNRYGVVGEFFKELVG